MRNSKWLNVCGALVYPSNISMYIYCTYNSKLVKKKIGFISPFSYLPFCQHYHVHLLYIQLKTCQKKNWFHLPTAILINNENSAGGNILVSELEANITNYIITPLHAHFDWFLFKFNVGYGRQMHWWCHNEQSSMSFFTS